ncbi:uncharacterized protein [Musca autumnalis]|uniref:uncharacterized protein n=1 Tax=Musca autumnalis TaxID=221902 RepID=UPI003CE6943E
MLQDPNKATVGGRRQQLSVVQINLHHCKAAATELLLTLSTSKIDIALVQEPYLYNNKVAGLSNNNYTVLAASNGDKQRRHHHHKDGQRAWKTLYNGLCLHAL